MVKEKSETTLLVHGKSTSLIVQSCFVLFLFLIYLFVREREREHRQIEWQAEAEGEAGSLPSREPDVGLDPRTLES